MVSILFVPHHSATAAGLEDQTARPYDLTIALRFTDDPIFTRTFVTSIERQVHDQLAGELGSLAKVQVITSHPLLETLSAGPLEELVISPATFNEHKISGKLFLVRIDHLDGIYDLQWRQLDGDVRQAGPVHAERTPDRQWVAKAVCLAVARDFAPLANIKPIKGKKTVQLAFRGSALGTRLAGWLQPPCVLQPFRVEQKRDGTLQRVPIANTILRLEKNGEPWQAAVESNLADPWKMTGRVVGFQAMKLNTQKGFLKLRVVDLSTGAPALGCTVYAGSQGFAAIGDSDRLTAPDREGVVLSSKAFDHLAYIKVSQGGNSVFQIPLPVTGPWCELVCRIPVDKAAGDKRDYERQLRYLVQDLRVAQGALDSQVREVNDLHNNKRYEEAKKRVTEGMAGRGEDIQRLKASQADLSARSEQLKLPASPLLALTVGQIKDLESRDADLRQLSKSLESTIDKIDSQSRANVLIDLAFQAEKEGDIEQALEKYALALAEQPDQPDLKQRLERMTASWRIKGKEHQQARDFIEQKWAKADVTQIAGQLPEAKKSFDVLQRFSDPLSARKLLRINADHIVALADVLVVITSSGEQADRDEQEKYAKLTDDLATFQETIGKFLEADLDKSAAPPASDPKAKAPPEEAPAGKKPAAAPPKKGDKEDGEEAPLDKKGAHLKEKLREDKGLNVFRWT